MATRIVSASGNELLPNSDGSINISTAGSVTVSNLSTTSSVTTVRKPAATSTVISVASSSTAATILAANTARLTATVANNSTSLLYLTLAASTVSSSTAFTTTLAPLAAGVAAYYEVPVRWTGVISGQHGTASNGAVVVTELTA